MSVDSQRDWTVLEALRWCTQYLAQHDDPNPRLSAQWLLSHVTGLSRVEVYAYYDRLLRADERAQLRDELTRRSTGEPLQYIMGDAPFRDLVLTVTPDVLIPRPETEGLVQLVIDYLAASSTEASENMISHQAPRSVLDLGTGSGAIALALAQECPHVQIVATDSSPEALAVAVDNAQRLGLDEHVEFICSDCYDALDTRRFDIIVSNPPYIPTDAMDSLETQVGDFEPRLALDGGSDGLDLFRRILDGSGVHLVKNGALFVELDERNVTQAHDLAVQLNSYSALRIVKDLNGRDRYVIACGLRD